MDRPKLGMRIAWSEEDEAFVARSTALAGVSALGDDPVEAARELETATAAALEAMADRGMPHPETDPLPTHSGQFRVRLPRSLHAWLVDRAELEGTSLNTLVVRLLSVEQGRLGAEVDVAAEFQRK